MTRTVDFAQTQRLSERVSQVRNFLEQLSPALASKETSELLTALVRDAIRVRRRAFLPVTSR